MLEENYSKRELDTHFENVKHLILDVTKNQNDKLDRIEQQVMKTNGRVTKHDDEIKKLELWKENIMAKVTAVFGGIGILWVFVKEFLIK